MKFRNFRGGRLNEFLCKRFFNGKPFRIAKPYDLFNSTHCLIIQGGPLFHTFFITCTIRMLLKCKMLCVITCQFVINYKSESGWNS